MLPPKAQFYKKGLDDRIQIFDTALSYVERDADGFEIAKLQSIASHYLVVAASGLLETGVQCEKIYKLLAHFDPRWKDDFLKQTTSFEKNAIDSLKGIRNHVAHGKQNGTSYSIVKKHYMYSTDALTRLAIIINPRLPSTITMPNIARKT